MPLSEAKRLANKKSDAKYQQILLKPYKAEAEQIRAAAARAGQSVQRYVLQAVEERIKRESGE